MQPRLATRLVPVIAIATLTATAAANQAASPADAIEHMSRALALTKPQQVQLTAWLRKQAKQVPDAKLTAYLDTLLDPSRRALYRAMRKHGDGKPVAHAPTFIDASHAGKTVRAPVGGWVVLAVPMPADAKTSASTATAWAGKLDNKPLESVGQDTDFPGKRAPGTTGADGRAGTSVQVWRAKREGVMEFTVRYKQGGANLKTLKFNVRVAQASDCSAKLIVKKSTYKLRPDLRMGPMVKALRGKGPLPPAPKVDLVLEVTNTSTKPIKLMRGSDSEMLDMDLDAPNALIKNARIAMTADFRAGKPYTLRPGQKLTIPIKSLTFGMRGVSKKAFWMTPGDYKLTVTYQGHYAHGDPRYKPKQPTFRCTAETVTLKVTK